MDNNKSCEPSVHELLQKYRGLLIAMESVAERVETILSEAREALEKIEAQIDPTVSEEH